MWRSACWRLSVGATTPVVGGAVQRGGRFPARRRQFRYHQANNHHHQHNTSPPPLHDGSNNRNNSSSSHEMPRLHHHHRAIPRDASIHSAMPQTSSSSSQRERHRRRVQQHQEDGEVAGVAASLLTPLPKSKGFYNGIDEYGVAEHRPSAEERREMRQCALEANAMTSIDFVNGGEADIQLNGLPAEAYHGNDDGTTIATNSAMYHNMFARRELDSRSRMNSWSVMHQREKTASAPTTSGDAVDDEDDVARAKRSLAESERHAPLSEAIGQPRSTYALRKLYVDGLVGYQGIISAEEEAQMSAELLQLLQDARAAYIAEECRYCINLYDTKTLGIPGGDALALAMHAAPTLQRVLHRFFEEGLIPSPPNVCQVSEMIGNFSGYPVHSHPQAVGSYVGVLNLVSPTMLYLQHKDAPWFPRVLCHPRSLFVVREPCLSCYKMGYKDVHQPFHTFDYATRISKDYRVEVLFACVEVEHMKHLHEAVQLTDYAEAKQQRIAASSDGGAASSPTTDAWMEKVRAHLHANEASSSSSMGGDGLPLPADGHALREELLGRGLVGSRPQPFTTEQTSNTSATLTPTQRRMAALKARYNFAQQLHGTTTTSSNDGPLLIRGFSPNDRKR